ncbi:DUF2262 domain-containing protein [Priestia koreensis]|uniref:DUF2262 domain-containing protein n=1 Tax=Priestia koreensis TaxID=284581 RepID=UPI00345A03F8
MHEQISSIIGIFTCNEQMGWYEQTDGVVRWCIEAEGVLTLLNKAEQLYRKLGVFDQTAKEAIADKLLSYKNDFWPEYDENDPDLDWDAVDAGAFDVTKDEFVSSLRLYDVVIKKAGVYGEYHDGDLFGGHRIHVTFDEQGRVLEASI